MDNYPTVAFEFTADDVAYNPANSRADEGRFRISTGSLTYERSASSAKYQAIDRRVSRLNRSDA
jgi:hypothetical protein